MLRLIRENGVATRAELGRLTGLSRPAVAARVAALIDRGLVVERSDGPSTGGRPPARLEFNAAGGTVLVANLGLDPPPLPPQGFLLAKLGYVEEAVAAIAIDVSPRQTMIEYHKKQIGPEYTVIGRTILYHPTKLEAWLAGAAPAPSRPWSPLSR